MWCNVIELLLWTLDQTSFTISFTFSKIRTRANDIYDNRIEKVLKSMDSILLYALPKTEPWTLERFLDEIKKACKEAANDLHRRSVMIEDAVEDLIGLALQVKKTRITKMIRLINVSTFLSGSELA